MGLATVCLYVCVHVCELTVHTWRTFTETICILYRQFIQCDADQTEAVQYFMDNAIQRVLSLGMNE